VQQLTGDYPSAAASCQRALQLFCDVGDRRGQADALNSLGQLATETADTGQARRHHARALTIARDLDAPLEQARALEGLGRAHLHEGNPREGYDQLCQALTIYQRIGAPAAHRVEETLRQRER
jgi:tetratricopeptide (TPR) repeat protein